MSIRMSLLTVTLLGPMLSGANCIPTGDQEKNFASFKQFTFTQNGALGFCPNLNTVYEALISRQTDGTHAVTLSVIQEGTAGSPNCRTDLDAFNADCVVVTEFPERPLTQEEEAELQSLFKRVTIHSEMYPAMCVDPCLVENFTWDSYSIDSGLVGCIGGTIETLSDRSRDEILAMLNSLRTDVIQANP